MIVPPDEYLAALDRAGITVDDLLADLDEARDEMVSEHYGAAFMGKLTSLGVE